MPYNYWTIHSIVPHVIVSRFSSDVGASWDNSFAPFELVKCVFTWGYVLLHFPLISRFPSRSHCQSGKVWRIILSSLTIAYRLPAEKLCIVNLSRGCHVRTCGVHSKDEDIYSKYDTWRHCLKRSVKKGWSASKKLWIESCIMLVWSGYYVWCVTCYIISRIISLTFWHVEEAWIVYLSCASGSVCCISTPLKVALWRGF